MFGGMGNRGFKGGEEGERGYVRAIGGKRRGGWKGKMEE